ncbi:MAG: hypothetical protein WAL87_05095 [Chthoniobacterales bacterium]
MPTKTPKSQSSTSTKASKSKSEMSPKTPAKKKPKATVRKKRIPGKASSKLAPGFSLEQKAPAIEPVISHDDIALRAYFIGERRQKMGWPGDSGTDWADAEKQLRAEALEKPLRKR